MAFIVEMWRGRPHGIVVEDVDENGELYVSAVIPNGPPDPERRTFACNKWHWEAAQDLARSFGWQPSGPLFKRWNPKGAAPIRQGAYEPDGWINGIHEVEANDASRWGEALTRCLNAVEEGRLELLPVKCPTLISDGMTLDQFRQANRGLTPQFLRAFSAFLSRGGFQFGWDS